MVPHGAISTAMESFNWYKKRRANSSFDLSLNYMELRDQLTACRSAPPAVKVLERLNPESPNITERIRN